MKKLIGFLFALGYLSIFGSPAIAQEETWQVGRNDEYHVAMVKQVDEVFVAIFVAKKPSIYGSPLLMETMVPCGDKKPMSFHSTEAVMAFGLTAEERLKQVREALEAFFENSRSTCKLADGIEQQFFKRFEDAYIATDAILVDAGVFPLAETP
mgnify:CR=1 FL=1